MQLIVFRVNIHPYAAFHLSNRVGKEERERQAQAQAQAQATHGGQLNHTFNT